MRSLQRVALVACGVIATSLTLSEPKPAAGQSTSFSGGVSWSYGGTVFSSRTFRVPSYRYRFVDGRVGVWVVADRFSTYEGPPLVDIARRLDPQIRAGYRDPEPEEQPTAPPDLGLVAFAEGDYSQAYRIYSVRSSMRPDDLEAARLRGLAAAGLGRFAEAGQIWQDVYDREPTLRHTPVPARQVIGLDALSRIILTAHRRGTSANSEQVWFANAVLHHAAGRRIAAERAYEKSAALR